MTVPLTYRDPVAGEAELVARHYGLVEWRASRRPYVRAEAISAGHVGILKAVRTHQPGSRSLTSWIVDCINHETLRDLANLVGRADNAAGRARREAHHVPLHVDREGPAAEARPPWADDALGQVIEAHAPSPRSAAVLRALAHGATQAEAAAAVGLTQSGVCRIVQRMAEDEDLRDELRALLAS